MPKKGKILTAKTVYLPKDTIKYIKDTAKKENKFFTEVINETLERGIKNVISK